MVDMKTLTIDSTQFEIVDAEARSDIASLQAAVGSPLVASTVSAMTDHNKVYVYTGSESGYTSGNWYYWNGTAWTSGGVYNAVAIETDDTLSIADMAADAKATGDEITDLKSAINQSNTGYVRCESGTYANGQKQDNVTRVRNESPLSVEHKTMLYIPQGYEAYVLRLDRENTFIDAYSMWITGLTSIATIITDETAFIDIIVKKTGFENQDISSDVGYLTTNIWIAADTYSVLNDLMQLQTDYVQFESGTFSNERKTENITRLRNSFPISINGVETFSVPTGYEAYILRLDRTKTFLDGYQFWVNGTVNVSEVITDQTRYINLIIRKETAVDQDISSDISIVSNGLVISRITDQIVPISNTVENIQSAISQSITGYVDCESGTYSNGQKQVNVTRIRNVEPISTYNMATIYIPQGYEAYVLRLDLNKYYISAYPLWITGLTDLEPLLTSETAFIDIIVKKTGFENQDISNDVIALSRNILMASNAYAVTSVSNNLTLMQTNYIQCESGTFSDNQKMSDATRIRNSIPIPVIGYKSLSIPTGYEAYILRLDRTKVFIDGYQGWTSGNVEIATVITDQTRYINLIIRKASATEEDISGDVMTVSSGLILTPIIDELETIETTLESMEDDTVATRKSIWESFPIGETVNGKYVCIDDGAENVPTESVVLTINPNAVGINPKVYCTGKNILPLTVENIKTRNSSGTWTGNSYSNNGITYTIEVNSKEQVTGITVTGTASSDSTLFLISFMDYLTNGVSYLLSGCPDGGSLETYSLRWVTSNFDNASSDIGSGTTLIYDSDWTRVYIDVKSGVSINDTFYPMIRFGDVKSAEFEAYKGTVYSVPTPSGYSAFYSGQVDVVSGKATSEYKAIDLGSFNWIYESTGTYSRFYAFNLQGDITAPADNDTKADLYCDGYTTDSVNAIFGFGTDLVVACSATGVISVSDSRYTTASGFIEAISGTILVYRANTNVDYTFSPVDVRTVKGLNNIWSNADGVKVVYRADSQLYINTDHYDFYQRYKEYEETQVAEYLTVGLPIIELFGDVTGISKDTKVNLRCKYKDYNGSCTLKWQGASSLAYQKKNYTITFGSKITINDDWGRQKKYVLKANYIDPTQARNVVAGKLWGQIVKSRTAENPDLSGLVNGGAVDGFPVIVVLNGKFHGLYTLNIPKDAWMFGMTGSAEHEGFLGAEDHTAVTQFKSTVTEEELEAETSFSVEYTNDEDNIGWMATSVSRAITSVINANSVADKATISQYIDLDSAIDYYIFVCLILGIDCTDKNYLLATFEGTKWCFSAYDLDSIMGLHWAGGRYLPATGTPTFSSYASLHKLMGWIYNYDRAALKARYAELRSDILSVSNVANEFYNFCAKIPEPIKDIEYKRWNLIPASYTTDVSQIVNWYRQRVEIMDAEIDAL